MASGSPGTCAVRAPNRVVRLGPRRRGGLRSQTRTPGIWADCCVARWQTARGTDAEAAAQRQLGEALEGQLGMVRELLDLEPEAVWPRKQVAHMLGLQARAGVGEAAGSNPAKTARAAWRELETLDPARAAYYRYMHSAT